MPVADPSTNESPWHQPWSEPVRTKIAPAAAIALMASGLFAPVLPTNLGGETVPGPNVSYPYKFQYQAKAEPVFVGQTESIRVDKWYVALSGPVRTPPRLIVAAQQPFAFVLNPNTQITQNFESRWHQPWSEPVRQKPGLGAANRPFMVSWGVRTPTVETVTVDKWYVALTVPVRSLPRLQPGAQPFSFPSTRPIVSFGWHQWLSEPVRQKAGLGPHLQQTTAFQRPIEIINLDKWYKPWEPPVRVKPSFIANQQAYAAPLITTVEAVTVDKWCRAWVDPPKAKLSLAPAAQQSTAFVKAPPFGQTISFDWFQNLSDPPKPKASLGVANQQFSAFVKAAPFPEATFESKWHYPWSEPVRNKAGLWASHQATTAFQPIFTPTTISITGVLNAVETKDIAIFGGIVFNAPGSAQVGIIELSFSPMVGIVERPLVAGISGIIEQGTSPTPGSAVPIVSTAAVSIREI